MRKFRITIQIATWLLIGVTWFAIYKTYRANQAIGVELGRASEWIEADKKRGPEIWLWAAHRDRELDPTTTLHSVFLTARNETILATQYHLQACIGRWNREPWRDRPSLSLVLLHVERHNEMDGSKMLCCTFAEFNETTVPHNAQVASVDWTSAFEPYKPGDGVTIPPRKVMKRDD